MIRGKALLSGPQFSHPQNGALDGHLYPRYLAAIIAPSEEMLVLLFVRFQASMGRQPTLPGEPASELSSEEDLGGSVLVGVRAE